MSDMERINVCTEKKNGKETKSVLNMRPADSEYPLMESICFCDGLIAYGEYHFERMRRSTFELYRTPVCFSPEELLEKLSVRLPAERMQGLFKCRVLYGKTIGPVSCERYVPRTVRRLKWVDAPHLDYHLKYSDRRVLEYLRSKRGFCDDILIGQEGWVTDTSYSNVVFRVGNEYYTPCSCLLEGVRRQRLLEEGKIKACPVHVSDLDSFQEIILINTMLDLSAGISLPVSEIIR